MKETIMRKFNVTEATAEALESRLYDTVYWYCFERDDTAADYEETIDDLFSKKLYRCNSCTLNFDLDITNSWNGAEEEFSYLPEEVRAELETLAEEDETTGYEFYEEIVEECAWDVYNEKLRDRHENRMLMDAYEYLEELCEEWNEEVEGEEERFTTEDFTIHC